jgi:hypothetical protein
LCWAISAGPPCAVGAAVALALALCLPLSGVVYSLPPGGMLLLAPLWSLTGALVEFQRVAIDEHGRLSRPEFSLISRALCQP